MNPRVAARLAMLLTRYNVRALTYLLTAGGLGDVLREMRGTNAIASVCPPETRFRGRVTL